MGFVGWSLLNWAVFVIRIVYGLFKVNVQNVKF